jgi:hypothetical protein
MEKITTRVPSDVKEWLTERAHYNDATLGAVACSIMFHNIRFTSIRCRSKAKMSALSIVEMSVSAPFWEFGGCYFDGHGDG